jgi:hypothetical protein
MGSVRSSIFSAYRAGENRVTGSIIAVLQSLSLRRFESLLGSLAGSENENLIKVLNQKSDEMPGVPDAEVFASFRILIETKTVPNAVNEEQLRRHVARFARPTGFERLTVLTPDSSPPPAIAALNDSRIIWAGFKEFSEKITTLLDSADEVISEREEFLLRHLLLMFEEENLLNRDREVVVVAARDAWPTYKKSSAYICQPNRPLGGATRLAFYAQGQICDRVPKILMIVEDIAVGEAHESPEIQRILADLSRDPSRPPGKRNQIVLLTSSDDPATERLAAPIKNTLKSKQQPDLPVAFTMGQRYVSLEALKRAHTTGDLLRAE